VELHVKAGNKTEEVIAMKYLVLIGGAFMLTGMTLKTPDPALLTARAQAAAQMIESVLLPGVDQCFNPKHPRENQQTKASLALLAKVLEDIASSNRTWTDLGQPIADLKAELLSFDKSLGPFCLTKRTCLEAGFVGNVRYPLCQPVEGDPYENVQYTTFEKLVDDALPSIVSAYDDANPP
jgi:hypothetical protein